MTAVVGILNKKAVAIAADSAATSSNGKIFNKANKIFSLSKEHSVGIVIHNKDSFLFTPWEVIISVYKERVGVNTFKTLKEYQEDFIKFLVEKDFFCSKHDQLSNLFWFLEGINDWIINETNELLKVGDPEVPDYLTGIKKKAKERIDFFSSKTKLSDFDGYTLEQFTAIISSRIKEVFDESFTNKKYPLDDESQALLINAYYSQIIVQESNTMHYTGIIFTGYGTDEIFPSLISLQVYLGIDGRLRYFITDRGDSIHHTNSSAVCMFAQQDVMLTILTGVAPDLQEAYNLTFETLLSNYEEVLLKNYTSQDKGDLMFLLEKINKKNITQIFTDEMQKVIQKKYIYPLYAAVAGLSKSDLCEMAESLIYLTYLQRRITNAEESVGGPVDVALISKGEGFTWVKRKPIVNLSTN